MIQSVYNIQFMHWPQAEKCIIIGFMQISDQDAYTMP